MAKTMWGNAFHFASAMVGGVLAVPAACLAGAAYAVAGEQFRKGSKEIFDLYSTLAESVGEFGDRHAEQLTQAAKGLAAVAASVVVTDAVHASERAIGQHLHHRGQGGRT